MSQQEDEIIEVDVPPPTRPKRVCTLSDAERAKGGRIAAAKSKRDKRGRFAGPRTKK